jgi:protein TonB
LALSLALHACLMAGWRPAHLLSAGAAVSAGLQLRIVQADAPDGSGHAAAFAAQPSAAPLATPPQVTANPTAAAPEQVPAIDLASPRPSGQAAAGEAVSGRQALPPAPAYRNADGLEPPPRALQPIDPEYPEAAGLTEGTVVLRLLISSSGTVDEVAVVRATPEGIFEASALAAFAQARFSPGYFLGIPVKCQLFVEVGYSPVNRGVGVSGQAAR